MAYVGGVEVDKNLEYNEDFTLSEIRRKSRCKFCIGEYVDFLLKLLNPKDEVH